MQCRYTYLLLLAAAAAAAAAAGCSWLLLAAAGRMAEAHVHALSKSSPMRCQAGPKGL